MSVQLVLLRKKQDVLSIEQYYKTAVKITNKKRNSLSADTAI